MKYALINSKDIVINVIQYDPERSQGWQPPKGCYIIPSSIASVGDWYNKETNQFLRAGIIQPERE